MNFATFPCALLFLFFVTTAFAGLEEEEGVRYADRCEACKILATELQGRLTETGKSHDVLETGYVGSKFFFVSFTNTNLLRSVIHWTMLNQRNVPHTKRANFVCWNRWKMFAIEF